MQLSEIKTNNKNTSFLICFSSRFRYFSVEWKFNSRCNEFRIPPIHRWKQLIVISYRFNGCDDTFTHLEPCFKDIKMLSLSFTPLILLTLNKTLLEVFSKEVRVKYLFTFHEFCYYDFSAIMLQN